MKHRVKGGLLVALFLCTATAIVAKDKTDRTFFMPRSQNVNLPMEMVLWHKATARDKKMAADCHYQTTAFYQHSTNGDDLAEYFFFEEKEILRIGKTEDDDIHPEHFNLPTDFESDITIDPEAEVWGVRFDSFKELGWLLKGLYVNCSTTILHAHHSMELRETVRTEGTEHRGPNTMIEAMRGVLPTTEWRGPMEYARIDRDHKQNGDSGAADIDCRIGYRFVDGERYKFGINFAITTPTSNESRARYVFEPMIGYGGHFAIGGGFDGDFKVWMDEAKERSFKILVYGNYRYLFQRCEMRTLELKDKNWGRYISMLEQDPNNITNTLANKIFGANVLTRKVKVEPGSQIDFMIDLSLKISSWVFDIGYNLWWREEDDLKLKEAFDADGVFGLIASGVSVVDNGDGCFCVPGNQSASNTISSLTTIKTFGNNDGIFLKEEDLDLERSGQEDALTHKIFGNVGYQLKGDHPVLIGAGASYEFAGNNEAFDQWGVWIKLAASF